MRQLKFRTLKSIWCFVVSTRYSGVLPFRDLHIMRAADSNLWYVCFRTPSAQKNPSLLGVNASFACPHNNQVYEAKVFFTHAIVVRFFVSSFFQCLRSRLFHVKWSKAFVLCVWIWGHLHHRPREQDSFVEDRSWGCLYQIKQPILQVTYLYQGR